jgi:hypothetical protein
MPWPEKQRRAIFLSVKRRKGEAAAKRLMHEAGYGNPAKSKGHAAHDHLHTRGKKK